MAVSRNDLVAHPWLTVATFVVATVGVLSGVKSFWDGMAWWLALAALGVSLLLFLAYMVHAQSSALADVDRRRPGPDTTSVHRPPVISDESVAHSLETNLPQPDARLVGRQAEQEDIRRAMKKTRFVTLLGPGGVGKSLIALHVAHARWRQVGDSAHFVELLPVESDDEVMDAIAESLEVRAVRGRALLETVVQALRHRRLLIVLDNCEHVIGGVREVVKKLRSELPELTLLLTSRERLDVAGEQVIEIKPLQVPAADARTVRDIEQTQAVELFVSRARLAKPDFTLTQAQVPALAEICRRLDGLPLALVMAAAQVDVMAVDDIRNTLTHALDWQYRDAAASDEHHRTLRATIAWTFDRLDPQDRALLRQLSVFEGPFTAKAANICSEAGFSGNVHDSLKRLVKASLVQRAPDAGGPTYYSLLSTVREFGRAQFSDGAELRDLRRRHAQYFLHQAQDFAPRLRSAHRAAYLECLEREHNDLRAVLRWGGREGSDPYLAQALAGALFWFWNFRGHLVEGRRWLEESLEFSDDRGRCRAQALYGAGTFAFLQGELAPADQKLEASAALWQEVEEPNSLGYVFTVWSLTKLFLGDAAKAQQLAERGVALFEQEADPWGLALANNDLSVVLTARGDHAPGGEAERRLKASLDLWVSVGDSWGRSLGLTNLGTLEYVQGKFDQAEEDLLEALDIQLVSGDRWGEAASRLGLGDVNVGRARGRDAYLRQAYEQYWSSLLLHRALGRRQMEARCLDGLAHLAVKGGRLVSAAGLLAAADALRRAGNIHLAVWEQRINEACLREIKGGAPTEAVERASESGRRWTPDQILEQVASLG